MLNIVTIGYNEEVNLNKFFISLKYIKSKIKIRHIFVDQSSNDKTLKIAKNYGCELYIHKSKGYADPDKKWVVNNLLKNNDRCLILDCDEELTKQLSDEIIYKIKNNNFNVYKIKLKTFFLGKTYVFFKQYRLFKKKSILITNKIHNYLILKEKKVGKFKNFIINIDKKNDGKNIYNHINKINIYSEKELKKFKNLNNIKIIFFLFTKPIITFFQWYLYNKLIFQGLSGLIVSLNMCFYRFIIYAKLYEKNITKHC